MEKKSTFEIKGVIDHPDCQHAIEMLGIENKEFFIYGGAVRDRIQYDLGRTTTYAPNDFDFILRTGPNIFQNHLATLVKDGVLTPTKKGKAPFFRMGLSENFRVLWSDPNGDEKNTDIKCIGTENLKDVLAKGMFSIDSMSVDKGGILHDPILGFNDLINKRVDFNEEVDESIKKSPSSVFRYYAMCDGLNVEPTLGEEVCRIAAPLIPERPFYEFNSRLNAVLAKKNGHLVFNQLYEEGLFNYLPLPYTLNPRMVDQAVYLEQQLSLNPMRGTRVLAAFHDEKVITDDARQTTIENLKARLKWKKKTETREDRIAKLAEKFSEKVAILKLSEKIDRNSKILKKLGQTSWGTMNPDDQLAVFLLSNAVYKEFTYNYGQVTDKKATIMSHVSSIRETPKGAAFFKKQPLVGL